MLVHLVLSILAAAGPAAAQPAACELPPQTYERWLAANTSRTKKGTTPTTAANGSTAGPVYDNFIRALAETKGELQAVQACCAMASADRLGAVSCSLVSYVAGGRKDSVEFLAAFPGAPGESALLWDMDAIYEAVAAAGVPVPGAFGSKRPSERLIEELFLLVLDEKEDAIAKFFNVASSAPAYATPVIDSRIELMLREAPSVLVTNWLVLRKHKRKLQAVSRSMLSRTSREERNNIAKRIEVFCGSRADPYCWEILGLVGGR